MTTTGIAVWRARRNLYHRSHGDDEPTRIIVTFSPHRRTRTTQNRTILLEIFSRFPCERVYAHVEALVEGMNKMKMEKVLGESRRRDEHWTEWKAGSGLTLFSLRSERNDIECKWPKRSIQWNCTENLRNLWKSAELKFVKFSQLSFLLALKWSISHEPKLC